MDENSKKGQALGRLHQHLDSVAHGTDKCLIIVEPAGEGAGYFFVRFEGEEEPGLEVSSSEDPLLVNEDSQTKKWFTEPSRIFHGRHPFRDSAYPFVHNNLKEEAEMAGKRGVGDLVVAARKTGLFGRFKRMVGLASTAGIAAFFLVPGPHTVVVIGGFVAGAVVAMVTGKK